MLLLLYEFFRVLLTQRRTQRSFALLGNGSLDVATFLTNSDGLLEASLPTFIAIGAHPNPAGQQ